MTAVDPAGARALARAVGRAVGRAAVVLGALAVLVVVEVFVLRGLARAVLVGPGSPPGVDRVVAEALTLPASGAGWALAGAVGQLGAPMVLLPVGVVLVALAWRRRSPVPPVLVGLAVLGATAVTAGVRRGVSRMGPPNSAPGPGATSYPSGHVVVAAAVAFALALVVADGRRPTPRPTQGPTRWPTLGVALGVAAVVTLAVAWARVAKGLHWPSEVVVGAALGASWAFVAARAVTGSWVGDRR